MSRYVNRIQTPADPNALTQPITDFMKGQGFSLYNYKGDVLWKKGMGLLLGPQYVLILYGPDYIEIQAFVKMALLPGVYVGEMGLDGMFGVIPKQQLRGRVASLEQYVYSLWNHPASQPAPPTETTDADLR